MKEIKIDGIIYVPKSEQKNKADSLGKFPYVIVRTYSARSICWLFGKKNRKRSNNEKSKKTMVLGRSGFISSISG